MDKYSKPDCNRRHKNIWIWIIAMCGCLFTLAVGSGVLNSNVKAETKQVELQINNRIGKMELDNAKTVGEINTKLGTFDERLKTQNTLLQKIDRRLEQKENGN